MRPHRPISALALGGTVLLAGSLLGTTVAAAQGDRTYRFTIVNLTSGQPLTPPVVVLHDKNVSIVQAGQPASESVAQIAENGNNQPLLDALTGVENVHGVGVGETPLVAGGVPGAAEFPGFARIEVSADKNARLFSVIAMLICTNDGFAIVHDTPLPKKVGQAIVVTAHAYDAGSEINTEDLSNMVPPCQGLVGVSTEDEGTGESDPSIAENGVITPHQGIVGSADLDPVVHRVATMPDAPALIIVERIS